MTRICQKELLWLLADFTSSCVCRSLSSSSFWISASDRVLWVWFIVLTDCWPHFEEDGSCKVGRGVSWTLNIFCTVYFCWLTLCDLTFMCASCCCCCCWSLLRASCCCCLCLCSSCCLWASCSLLFCSSSCCWARAAAVASSSARFSSSRLLNISSSSCFLRSSSWWGGKHCNLGYISQIQKGGRKYVTCFC